MKRFAHVATLTMTLALLGAAGCKKDDDATEEDYDDVATAVGALVGNESGGERGSMEDSVDIATGATDTDLTNMGSGSYEGTRLGLRYAYEVTCSDADGNVQEACDANTDSANLVLSWSGELTLPHYQASIERTGDWTLSGLQTDTAVFNGHGTFDVNTEFQGFFRPVTRTFKLDYDADYQEVTFDRVGRQFESGHIDYEVHALRTVSRNDSEGEAEFNMSVDVDFLGDGRARISIDSSHEYNLDLGTGGVSKE